MSETLKDASHLLDVEKIVFHAERDNFRISEITISTSQKVPWHYHNHIKDTFYVLEGEITIYLREPKESIRLTKAESLEVPAGRPHLVTNSANDSATFLVLQGVGEYDYVPLTE